MAHPLPPALLALDPDAIRPDVAPGEDTDADAGSDGFGGVWEESDARLSARGVLAI